jgi:iron complex outermembrane receptor protein
MKLNVFTLLKGVLVISLIILSLTISYAQQIALKDADSREPIIGATYQYGDQKGITDALGQFDLTATENEYLRISHIAYGDWSLNPSDIALALQTGEILREEAPIIFNPITIIALRPHFDEASAMKIQDRDRLSHDGGDLLARTPLIAGIRKSGSYGFDPVMRGFKYDQLNVVINGLQTANAACPNRMDPPTSQVAPNMIDQVEILKGPHALRYGNTVGGTINYVSAKPNFSDASKYFGRVTGNYESNGNIFRTEGMAGYESNGVNVGLFGSWSTGNDYQDGDDNTIPGDFNRGSFGANLAFKVQSNQILKFSAIRNIARDVDFPALMMDLRSDDTWLLNANYVIQTKGKYLKSIETTVFATMVDHTMDNYSKPMTPRMVDAITHAQTHNYGGRSEGTWKFDKSKLLGGLDVRYEQADGTRTRTFLMGPNMGNSVNDNVWQNGRIIKPGVFGEYAIQNKRIDLMFGGRLEVNYANVTDPAPEFTNVNADTELVQVNPGLSVGIVNKFSPKMSLGLWLARVQRSGSLTERYINYFPVGVDPYEMLGNPDLLPEVNNQLDFTYTISSAVSRFELSLFGSLLQDYISSEIRDDLSPRLPMSPGVRQYINLDQAVLAGFEASWSQVLFANLQHEFSMAYTYGENINDKAALPEIAPFDARYTLFGSYFRDKFRPEVSLRYVAQAKRISSAFGETVSPSFFVTNIEFNYSATADIRIAVGANNLFDVTYYEHLNRKMGGNELNAPGRNIFVRLAIDLN